MCYLVIQKTTDYLCNNILTYYFVHDTAHLTPIRSGKGSAGVANGAVVKRKIITNVDANTKESKMRRQAICFSF
ncbi:hypothetical protein EB796_010753 [Bugula neritina]|uniref:Uncharacterized protein n=1 Tax=Bugula neritina TaxID=10212 RepID=A0A7J7JWY7_BUGNE|nr:hypothetical protein EB796_010753 [Bugula neritina]